MKPKIAVLMTSHNRCPVTLECLRLLFGQNNLSEVGLDVYLVDAGSRDGTREMVQTQFPTVHLIERQEDLFWCGGMRVAYDEACRGDYDYYLWLNDDSMLFPDALTTMLDTEDRVRRMQSADAIIAGAFSDPETGKHAYGGVVRLNSHRPVKFTPLVPTGRPERCDTMNGNCVLVPRSIANLVGNISPEFSHRMGDVDYGLRARAKGVSSWTTEKYIGTCGRNEMPGWLDKNVPLRQRLRLLYSPKGMPPREWMFFTRRHVGACWPFYVMSLYFRTFFPKLRKPSLDA